MLQIRNDLEIVLLLLNSEMHLRGIASALRLVPSTAMRILDNLEEASVVEFRMQGKNKIYSLRTIPEAKLHILMAEHYKLLKSLEHPQIRRIYKEIIRLTKDEMIIIFGSCASGNMRAGSDIDLYVDTTNKRLMEDIRKISDKISLQAGKLDKETTIAKEIKKNHIVLQNAEKFYQKTIR